MSRKSKGGVFMIKFLLSLIFGQKVHKEKYRKDGKLKKKLTRNTDVDSSVNAEFEKDE